MTSSGMNVKRVEMTCRANICEVKCVSSPREQCLEDLRRVEQTRTNEEMFDAIGYQDTRGYALYKLISADDVASLSARRIVIERIAQHLHVSPALEQCKQNASAHGFVLLYVDVPRKGTPSVRVAGELAMSADADCVSKALLAVVIDEHVDAPLSGDDLPIAVKL